MTSQEANSIPLGDILSHYGYEPSRRYGGYDMYRSPFRSDTSPSFKVFREENRWYDFGDGTYGRAVDLGMLWLAYQIRTAPSDLELWGEEIE